MDYLQQLGIQPQNPGVISMHGWAHSHVDHNSFHSYSPTNTQKIATIINANPQDYEKLILRAQAAAPLWQNTPAPRRGEIIRQFGMLLRDNHAALAKLISYEMGKPIQESIAEVQEMIDIADFAVGLSRMLYGKTMPSERIQHRLLEQWHPYGIQGVFTAFNFPMAVWSWNAMIGAVCGNITIWKPSSKTPLCAIAIQYLCNKLAQETGCPEIFNLFICESHDLAQQFFQDQRINLVAFTGSTYTGSIVSEQVAKRLGRSILELGGNNAAIIDASANLALAIPAIIFGAISTAGQRCTSTRRLFIHHSRWQETLEQLMQAYQQIKIGDPFDNAHHIGPLVDNAAVVTYTNILQQIQDANGQILFGGSVLQKNGCYVQPTIITNLHNTHPLVQQETFAPILYVMPFQSIEEAIMYNNQVTQGLSSALFSQDHASIELFLSASGSDCGLANINTSTSGAEIGGAFGGEKATGGGRESGSDAWKQYMRRQTVTINGSKTLSFSQGIQGNYS